MKTFSLPPGLVSDEIQAAWDLFHEKKSDTDLVESVFLTLSEKSEEGKFNYAKFLMSIGKNDEALVLLEAIKNSTIAAEFYIAHYILWTSRNKKRAIHYYASSAKKGHIVSNIWYRVRIIQVLSWKKRLIFCRFLVSNVLSAFVFGMKNARKATMQL